MIDRGRPVEAAEGYQVGDIVRLSAEPVEVVVSRVTVRTVFVEWPWRTVDPGHHWDGRMGFPRDPDHHDWRGTPWRMEPDGRGLSARDVCIVGVPETFARVELIEHFDPPAAFGWIPRPEWLLGLRPLEFAADLEAGFAFYLDDPEPVEIEVVTRISTSKS
ncbi:hypothetical protein [Actinospica robiniae]|uniref:Uncharacterized protein n=1 Tax=Actinospica robiniae DSM 44927 TaxID=479430 RepID=W9DZA7_9ACTN|nr:hypothetical protein [Actinospica robiniae]ETA71153.1 hypothetical protein ActroDRAFT_0179 [Actinospica robiniae DSM 44927]